MLGLPGSVRSGQDPLWFGNPLSAVEAQREGGVVAASAMLSDFNF